MIKYEMKLVAIKAKDDSQKQKHWRRSDQLESQNYFLEIPNL